jgi:hypothetical protein
MLLLIETDYFSCVYYFLLTGTSTFLGTWELYFVFSYDIFFSYYFFIVSVFDLVGYFCLGTSFFVSFG